MADEVFWEFDIAGPDVPAIRQPTPWEGRAPQTVLMCPGTEAELLPVDSQAQVLSWACGPSKPLRDHVHEALALLDEAGVKDCTVVGWSAGTVVALELARRYPDRVRGLMLLAGPPTTAADALLGALGVPQALRRLLAIGGAASLRLTGDMLASVTSRLPVTNLSAQFLQHSGLLRPDAERTVAEAVLRQLLHPDWQSLLALSLTWTAADRMRVTGLSCPLTVLTGQHDVLADFPSITRTVATLPQTRVRKLPASHFLPFEAAGTVREELALLLRRVETVECARLGIDPPIPAAHSIRIRK